MTKKEQRAIEGILYDICVKAYEKVSKAQSDIKVVAKNYSERNAKLMDLQCEIKALDRAWIELETQNMMHDTIITELYRKGIFKHD